MMFSRLYVLAILMMALSIALPVYAQYAQADITPPSVGLVSPTSAAVNTEVTLSAPYSDAAGVASCNLYVDSNNQGNLTLSGTTSGTASRSHTFLIPKTYQVYVRCFDGAGNVGAGTSVALVAATVSVTAPAADTIAPSAPGSAVRTSPDSDNTPTFTWFAAQDNVGVSGYEVRIEGDFYSSIGNVTTYTAGALTIGNHTFGVRARDAAGNVSETATVSFTITAASPASPATGGPPFTLEAMVLDAQAIVQGTSTVASCQMDTATAANRVRQVFGVISNEAAQSAIINFTGCGTISTRHLGAGERLGVVNSYKSAFGRLPQSQDQWYDVMKIANGRFPGEASAAAEVSAKSRFRAIYRRAANMSQQNDKAAVTVMAYGLRPLPRNLNSERAAISIFKSIFSRGPSSATDWDAVRAIAYSGAKR